MLDARLIDDSLDVVKNLGLGLAAHDSYGVGDKG